MLVSNISTYKNFLKDSAEPLEIRKAMERRYQEINSISKVTQEFSTTRKTVCKDGEKF